MFKASRRSAQSTHIIETDCLVRVNEKKYPACKKKEFTDFGQLFSSIFLNENIDNLFSKVAFYEPG